MRVIHDEYERRREKISKPHAAFCTFLILSIMYLISASIMSVPGTYAWLTSETNAAGTITNATTEDLLTFHSSEVLYGEQCSIQHTLKVKNISEINTTIIVSLSTGSGYETAANQKVKSGQTITVKPNIPAESCEAETLVYRIQGFHQYVDETFQVPVDTVKLKETIVPKVKGKPETKPEKNKKDEQKENEEVSTEPPKADQSEGTDAADSEEQQPADGTEEEAEPSESEEPAPEEQPSDPENAEGEQVSDENSPEQEQTTEDNSGKESIPALNKEGGNEKPEA
jgi:hypothetical protein